MSLAEEEEEREGVANLQDLGVDPVEGDDLAWDWAVTEAVQEAHPLKISEPAQGSALAVQPKPRHQRTQWPAMTPLPWKQLVWIYGSHHKAGTDLLRSLAIEQARVSKVKGCLSYGAYGYYPRGCVKPGNRTARLWLRCRITAQWMRRLYFSGENFRSAHIVRDPIAMVVSGYVYHRKNNDTPPALLVERNMSMADGLKLETQFVLNNTGRKMVDMYHNAPPQTMQLKFESFTRSSASFDEEAKRLYDHMVGDQLTEEQRTDLDQRAALHDLRRHPTHHAPGHVADPDIKKTVKEVVDHLPAELLDKLKEMRKSLGYE